MFRAVCLMVSAAFVLAAQGDPVTGKAALWNRVPYVGCRTIGQVESPAVKGKPRPVQAGRKETGELAYYSTESIGTLAPRGWDCYGIFGSSGFTVVVSPRSEVSATESGLRREFTGPAVQASYITGNNFSAFDVAQVIARVFPAHKAFVEALAPKDSLERFPSGPYPFDILKYKGSSTVEFTTPPNQEGLGTHLDLRPNNSPIHGAAMLVGETPGLLMLAFRLPKDLSHLRPVIVAEFEREAARQKW